jgi:type II secretory pathway pseudopilin PulG
MLLKRRAAGFTMVEALVASVIVAVVAGGTMMSLVTAARISRAQSSPGISEATGYARETTEKFRNHIACGPPWFDAACNPLLPVGWQADPLPGAAGSESILNTGAARWYRVSAQDCDGNAAPGDCFQMEVKVCWNNEPAGFGAGQCPGP